MRGQLLGISRRSSKRNSFSSKDINKCSSNNKPFPKTSTTIKLSAHQVSVVVKYQRLKYTDRLGPKEDNLVILKGGNKNFNHWLVALKVRISLVITRDNLKYTSSIPQELVAPHQTGLLQI